MSTQETEVVTPPAEEHPYYVLLRQWQQTAEAVRNLTAQERALREQLFAGTFPAPQEGVNKHTLPDGTVVKGTYKLTRKLDIAKLETAVKEGTITQEAAQQIVRVKYELDLKSFKDADELTRSALERQQVVTAAPALPTLEIISPESKE